MFKNTNLTGNPNFKLIEKTVQQLKEEEIEQKIKARTEQDAQKSWMGTIKDKQPEFPVKQSAWVTMGMGETTTADPTTDEILPKMARITKSPQ